MGNCLQLTWGNTETDLEQLQAGSEWHWLLTSFCPDLHLAYAPPNPVVGAILSIDDIGEGVRPPVLNWHDPLPDIEDLPRYVREQAQFLDGEGFEWF